MTKMHCYKLEKLISYVEHEHKAGRLNDQQRREVIQATLKPFEGKPNEHQLFLIGGDLEESTAQACGAALIAKLTEVSTIGSHTIRMLQQDKLESQNRVELK